MPDTPLTLRKSAPAKINLGLRVLRRRTDGYHDLETVFLRIPWADEITVEPAETLRMTCSDPALPTDEGNVCMKAALRLAEYLGERRGAAIHLEKRVPYGSGLGGGSSDAAATLELLAALWGAGIRREALQQLGAAVGSDVPFFLGPEAAHATGRGERLTPLLGSATGAVYTPPFTFVVVVPPVEIATAAAYGWVSPDASRRPDLRAAVVSNDLARWRREIVNDFERPVLARHPAVAAAKQMLADAGAGYASLSGSGSAVFGVFEEPAAATAAAEAAQVSGLKVWRGALVAG